MDYKALHWESIAFLQEHLYQRLTDPLNKAMSFLELAGSKEFTLSNPKLIDDAGRNLEILMMLVKSWSTLIEWKHKGSIADSEFSPLDKDKLPEWLLAEVSEHAVLRLEHTRTLKVQRDTFFEGLILLVNVAKTVGEISHVMSNDAEEPHTGVWLRVVFKPPKTDGFQSRAAVLDYLNNKDTASKEVAVQYAVADDLFALNNARFSLQKNTRTGHQAFATLLAVSKRAPSTPPKISEVIPLAVAAGLSQADPIETMILPTITVAEPAPPVVETMVSETEMIAAKAPTTPIDSPEAPIMSEDSPAMPAAAEAPDSAAPRRLTLLEIVKRTETSDMFEGDRSETLIINPFKAAGIHLAPPEPLTLPSQNLDLLTQSTPINTLNSIGMGALSKALLQMHADAEAKRSTDELASEGRDDAANASFSGGELSNDTSNSGSAI